MIRVVLREAFAVVRASPVFSFVSVVVVAGMVVAVMFTTGRTVAAEREVLAAIDSTGTRVVMVRAAPGAGLLSDVLGRVSRIEGIEWAIGFSAAVDGSNAVLPDGVLTPVRFAYGEHLERLGVSAVSAMPGRLAWVSERAMGRLGLVAPAGGVTLLGGDSFGVAGLVEVPDFLAEFEPLVLVPRPGGVSGEPLAVLLVLADSPELVPAVSEAVMSVADVADPAKLTVQTSETLAELRGLVEGQLGSFSRGLLLALLGVSGGLLAVLLFGFVLLRRRDFGRRRALGASRGFIVALVVLQTVFTVVVGFVLGVVVSSVLLFVSGASLPGFAFQGALAVLTLVVAVLAAAPPAIVAGGREPIRELRVP